MYFLLMAAAFVAAIFILIWLLSSLLGWCVFIMFIILCGIIVKSWRHNAGN
jgi:hypothetical protein